VEEMEAIGQEGNDCDGPKKYDVPQGCREVHYENRLNPVDERLYRK